MLALRENISQFKYIELVNGEKEANILNRLWILIKILVLSILEMLLVLPSINFFITNIRNLKKATEGLYVIAAFSITAFMYILLLLDKRSIKKLIDELQRIVNESEFIPKICVNHIKTFVFFRRNEKRL